MNPPPPHLDYEPHPLPPPRIWKLPRDLWFLFAGFSAFVAYFTLEANGPINRWPDLLFILTTTALCLLSLLNAFRLLLRI